MDFIMVVCAFGVGFMLAKVIYKDYGTEPQKSITSEDTKKGNRMKRVMTAVLIFASVCVGAYVTLYWRDGTIDLAHRVVTICEQHRGTVRLGYEGHVSCNLPPQAYVGAIVTGTSSGWIATSDNSIARESN